MSDDWIVLAEKYTAAIKRLEAERDYYRKAIEDADALFTAGYPDSEEADRARQIMRDALGVKGDD